MGDILQPIPDKYLSKLRDILRQEYPGNVHIYNFIDTTIKLKREHPKEDCINIYCPNGDFADGTFVAVIQMNCYDIIIYTMDKTLKRLETALTETKLINYDKKPIFRAMFRTYFDMIHRIRQKNKFFFSHTIENDVWMLSQQKALKFDYNIPEDLNLAPLNTTHSVIMNEAWAHKYTNSDKYIAKLIELNGGVGLFSKENNELRAWIVKHYFGGIGVLQVAEKHKRKGYGSLITKILSKIIAEQGHDVTGFIVANNEASQEMFSKLGFEKTTPLICSLPDYD